MKSDNILLIVAVIAVVISIIGTAITYNYLTSFRNKLTGFATSTGTVNLSVESAASINFTTSNINWGSGRVNAGQNNATLNTAGGANNVTNGNWTGNTAGFVVENIGNVNVTFDLKTGKTAAQLVGGSAGGGPQYQYNVTNQEVGSCRNSTGGTTLKINLGTFYNVNTTDPGTRICDIFPYDSNNDTIRIDVRLVIPSDSLTGTLSDTFTVTFAEA